MYELVTHLKVSGDMKRTHVVGLLGEGITRSLTPPMHREEARELGIDYEYRVIDTAHRSSADAHIDLLWAEILDEGYDAINVTHPYKQSIITKLDELSPDADRLGAVNLVVFQGQRAVGYNTDWTGFRSAAVAELGSLAGESVVQLGAGGAGAATAYAILDLGVTELRIAERDAQRGQVLAARLADFFPGASVAYLPSDDRDAALAAASGVVHATPTGMDLSPGVPFDVDLLSASAWVAEVVYLPLATELVRAARARGLRVLDGGRMAVGQAADSIRIITGREPDPQRMREHFLTLMHAREHSDR